MTHQIQAQSPPKKQAGFWTPWGNVRVPDLDKALGAKETRPLRRPLSPVEPKPLPLPPVRRD